jgi:hypothetical protein
MRWHRLRKWKKEEQIKTILLPRFFAILRIARPRYRSKTWNIAGVLESFLIAR